LNRKQYLGNFQQAAALPVEERVVVVDSLLRSLTPPDAAIDRTWVDLGSKAIDGTAFRAGAKGAWGQVFARIREQFAK
jgi:hypothetical protein